MIQEKSGSIETMRAVAVLLLVSYHVVGVNQSSGFGLDYPHSLRIFADFFIDVRMPLFAFIAGYVYGLRPVAPEGYHAFLGSGRFITLFSLSNAFYLLPFFLLGRQFVQMKKLDGQQRRWLISVSLGVIAFTSLWNVYHRQNHGEFSARQDLQSLVMGLACCLLAVLTLPWITVA